MAHQFLHAGAQEGEVGGVDDPVARQGHDVAGFQPVVGQHQAVAHEGMQAGFLEAVQQRGALHGQLAAHVVLAAAVELEEFAITQLHAAGLDLHQQQVAGGAQHHDVDLAVAVLAVFHRMPGHAVEDVVACRQRFLQAFEHVQFPVETRVLADGVEAGRECGHERMQPWWQMPRIVRIARATLEGGDPEWPVSAAGWRRVWGLRHGAPTGLSRAASSSLR